MDSLRDRNARATAGADSRRLLWIAAAIAVATLAIAFRCWRLVTVPPGLYIDEVLTARNALAWRLDAHTSLLGSRPLLMPGWVETSNLYLAFASAVMALAGDGLLGIRLVSVLPSLAAVPLLYWLTTQLAGRRTGLLAAFLLACSHWAARSGRTGWDAVLMVALQLAALACLVHAQRRGRIAPAFAGGVLVALSLYTCVASRLVLLHAVLWLAWEGIVLLRRPSSSADDNRAPLQRALLSFFAFLLAIIVIAAPLQQPAGGSIRVTQLSVFAHDHPWRTILDNLLGHLLMFHVRGGSYARDALPGFPMLDPITGALFLGLLAMALPAASALIRRLRRQRRVGARRGEGSQPRAAVLGEHGWDTHRQAGAPTAASPRSQPPSRRANAEQHGEPTTGEAIAHRLPPFALRLLLSWPAVMVLGGVLSVSGEGPPYPYRTLALAPWACLVAAIGGIALWDATRGRLSLPVRRAVATVALLAVVATNAWVVFVAGPRDPGVRHVYGVAPTRLGLWLADHAEGRPVVILPNALTEPPLPPAYPYAFANQTNFFRPVDQLAAVQLASGLYARHPERSLDPLHPAGDIELMLAMPPRLSRPTLIVLAPSQVPAASRRFRVDRRFDLRDAAGSPLATVLEARP